VGGALFELAGPAKASAPDSRGARKPAGGRDAAKGPAGAGI